MRNNVNLTSKNKLFNFRLMNVHFLSWSFNGLIVLFNIHQCFQLQNLLRLCNKLQSHKWSNIANIVNNINIMTHVYTHVCTYTQTHTNKSQNYIYIYIYIQHLIYW